MTQRKQISLPDDAAVILQSLTADCGIDASTVLTQLLRRYHPQLRQLFAISSNPTQPITVSEVPKLQNAVERRSDSQTDPPTRTPITDF